MALLLLLVATVGAVPDLTFTVAKTYESDGEALTQGLVYMGNDIMFESTGLREQSTLRKVRMSTGEVLKRVDLEDRYFGEGLAEWKGKLFQLTWESRAVFVYDSESFELLETLYLPFGIDEGWGLTHDGTNLILSDGTANVYFIDPDTFEKVSTILVHTADYPHVTLADQVNELEYVDGVLWANIWQTTLIHAIDPSSGVILATLDIGSLEPLVHEDRDVVNGIAFSADSGRLIVTGKFWDKVFEIVVPDRPHIGRLTTGPPTPSPTLKKAKTKRPTPLSIPTPRPTPVGANRPKPSPQKLPVLPPLNPATPYVPVQWPGQVQTQPGPMVEVGGALPPPPGSCMDRQGTLCGRLSTEGCFCDDDCGANGDCCADYTSVCILGQG